VHQQQLCCRSAALTSCPSLPCILLTYRQIPAAVALAGLPPIALDRYDLHHGHLFFAPACRQLGILFHAKVGWRRGLGTG